MIGDWRHALPLPLGHQRHRLLSGRDIPAGRTLRDIAPHEFANHLSRRPILCATRLQKCLPERTLDTNAQA